MTLGSLSRIDIDDVAATVDRVAAEIHRQLGAIDPPIPAHEIARALDIVEIREVAATNFEAVLVTDASRDIGSICVNRRSGRQRQRYSIAHELGHFLCGWHQLSSETGFFCSRQDLANPRGTNLHVAQEREANRFAIELLAPPRLVSRYLRGLPELEQVMAMHERLDISKAAAARRYVELHNARMAVVFATDGRVHYAHRGDDFPYLNLVKGQALPAISRFHGERLSEMTEADPLDWGLKMARGLSVQAFDQQDGHQIVLLHLDQSDDH